MSDNKEQCDRTSSKLTEFSGLKKDYKMWSKKFLVRARTKGYRATLLGKTTVPKANEALAGDSDEVRAKRITRKANESAYSDLISSMTEVIGFGVVGSACTEDIPEGSAALS